MGERMPQQDQPDLNSAEARRVRERITVARARVLTALIDCDSEAAAAAELGMTTNGLKSHIRDLKAITGALFDWGSWSGGYTWTYNATSYVSIGNPTAGYSFSQFVARKSPQSLPTKWIISGVDVPSIYVSYGTSPQYPGAPITSDDGWSFYVGFAMCKYTGHCLPVYYGWCSAQLEGRVAQNSTYGERKQSQYPYVVY